MGNHCSYGIIVASSLKMASVTSFPAQWLQELSNGTNWFHLLLLPSLVISSIIFIFRSLLINRSEPKILPPSPPTLPIIGNLHQVGNLPHRSFRDLSKKYGPIMLLHMGRRPTLVISSDEMAREVLKKNDLAVFSRPITSGPAIPLKESMDVAFAPYGEFWRQARKICVLDLLSIKRVQSFKSIREEEISLLVEKLYDSCSSGRPVNMSELLLSLTTNIISRCAFGRKFEEEDGNNTFGALSREFTALVGGFYVGDFFPVLGWIDRVSGIARKMARTTRELNAFIDKVIDEHIIKKEAVAAEEQQDFVDILLHARSDSKKLDYNFTRKNLRAIIVDMFTGGAETTTTGIEWAIAELIKNPRVMKKAQEEIRRVVRKKSVVSEDDIQQMNYLKCVMKETLRLHPPAPTLLPRETTTSVHINGYYIPPNTPMFINAWAIQRDSKVWNKPEEFIPERFIGNTIDFKGQDFEFIPFGSGRRICPGLSFAVAVSEIAIANFLFLFNWELPNGVRGEDLDMGEIVGVTTRKKIPLLLVPSISNDV